MTSALALEASSSGMYGGVTVVAIFLLLALLYLSVSVLEVTKSLATLESL